MRKIVELQVVENPEIQTDQRVVAECGIYDTVAC
jgi:hypothetical protein